MPTLSPSVRFGTQIACGLAALALVAAAPAQARTVQITLRGAISSGVDTGLFGTNDDLTGRDLTLVYRFDPASATVHQAGPGGETYAGGTVHGGGSFGSASVTINSVTLNFAGVEEGKFFIGPYEEEDLISGEDGEWYILTRVKSAFPITFQPGHFEPSGDPNDFWSGAISIHDFGDGTEPRLLRVDFDPSMKDIDVVPEPGAWALMLLGFGALGARLRARRNRATAAI